MLLFKHKHVCAYYMCRKQFVNFGDMRNYCNFWKRVLKKFTSTIGCGCVHMDWNHTGDHHGGSSLAISINSKNVKICGLRC